MADNPFLKLYKTIDSSQLFDIIDFPNDFQPLAVEAARLELESRQLTPEQLDGVKTRQDLRLKKKMQEKQAMQNIEDKMTSLIDTFRPIQKGRSWKELFKNTPRTEHITTHSTCTAAVEKTSRH